MARPKKIKVAKADGVVEEVKPISYTYHIKISVNSTVTEIDTDDVHQSLIDFPVPPAIKTDLVVSITKGGKTVDRIMNVFKGRRTLQNGTALELLAVDMVKQLG